MRRRPALLIGAFAATMALAWSSIAAAGASLPDPAALGGGYSASDAPVGGPTELRIDLKGRVPARCDLVSPPTAMGGLALTRAGESQAGFAIDCNTPFVIRVRSGGGGFANVEPAAGILPVLPYQIALEIGTDAGRQELGWCDAAALSDMPRGDCAYALTAPSRGWSSGDSTAIRETGSLRLKWQEVAGNAPMLGDYRDTIVIELEVRS